MKFVLQAIEDHRMIMVEYEAQDIRAYLKARAEELDKIETVTFTFQDGTITRFTAL